MSETNESKMMVVGKSAAAVNRVGDVLLGTDAELERRVQNRPTLTICVSNERIWI